MYHHACSPILLVAAALGARAESTTSTPFDVTEAPWARASRLLFLGATSPPPRCTDACMLEDDGDDCDDGGAPGSEFPMCAYCTDCADYGRGQPPVASSAPLRTGTGICTKRCFYASDCVDGGPASEFPVWA